MKRVTEKNWTGLIIKGLVHNFLFLFSFTFHWFLKNNHNTTCLQILFLLLLELIIFFFHPRFLGFRFTFTVYRLSTVTRIFFSQPHFLDFLLSFFPALPRRIFASLSADFGIWMFDMDCGVFWNRIGEICGWFWNLPVSEQFRFKLGLVVCCDLFYESGNCLFGIWNGYLLFLAEVWGLFFSRGFMNIFWL